MRMPIKYDKQCGGRGSNLDRPQKTCNLGDQKGCGAMNLTPGRWRIIRLERTGLCTQLNRREFKPGLFVKFDPDRAL